MTAIDDVIEAAGHAEKLRFSSSGSSEQQGFKIRQLAQSFDAQNIRSWRQWCWGGDKVAGKVVARHTSAIVQTVDALKRDGTPALVPAELVQAVMYVENNFNGGNGIHIFGWYFDKTPLPMNINYGLWQRAFATYNLRHPDAPITEKTVRHDAYRNIIAGTLILSTINAAIDPAIGEPERSALVASIYGNTEVTMKNGGPIMYGGKVVQVMETLYPAPRVEVSLPLTPLDVEVPVLPTRMLPASGITP